MTKIQMAAFAPLIAALGMSASAAAQQRPDPNISLAAQREALAAFSKMDGVWRGPAWTILPSGEKHHITQTERIGPLLDGAIKLVEGRGYEADGKTSFNAFAVISYNPATKSYAMRSHAMGQYGEFVIKPTADGYTWEIPAGPATIRYTAVIKDGVLKEIGERLVAGKEPMQFFEMTLKRVGPSDWPAGGAIAPK